MGFEIYIIYYYFIIINIVSIVLVIMVWLKLLKNLLMVKKIFNWILDIGYLLYCVYVLNIIFNFEYIFSIYLFKFK